MAHLLGAWSVAIAAVGTAFGSAAAFSCDQPKPEWIFCEDFSSGDLSRWNLPNQEINAYRAILEDPGPLDRAGNRTFRLRVPPGRGGTGLGVTFTPREYDRLYARWYIAYEAGFDFSAPNHGGGLHAGDRWSLGVAGQRPRGDDYFTIIVDYLPESGSNPPRPYLYAYYRGMRMDCADPDGACWGDHMPCMISASYCDRVPDLRVETYPPPLEHERWYCVEMTVAGGTPVESADAADGVVNLWVDGREIGPWESLWLRTTPEIRLNHFWLGLFHHTDHSVQGAKYDDVVVSVHRIGCHDNDPARSRALGSSTAAPASSLATTSPTGDT